MEENEEEEELDPNAKRGITYQVLSDTHSCICTKHEYLQQKLNGWSPLITVAYATACLIIIQALHFITMDTFVFSVTQAYVFVC